MTKLEDIDLLPVTINEARKSIRALLLVLDETQRFAIERGDRVIALLDEKLNNQTFD